MFSDIISALHTIAETSPPALVKESGITKDEQKLLDDARRHFFVPVYTYDYAAYYDSEEGDFGDPLDVLLQEEWEDYRRLEAALPPEGSRETSPETKAAIESELSAFYAALPELLTLAETLPRQCQEKVLALVSLRFKNTVLRGGGDPALFITE
jgi:hypothetical protein